MSSFTRAGRLLGVAALAASTALSGPLAAQAQQPPVRLAQAAPPPPEGKDAKPPRKPKPEAAQVGEQRGAEHRAPDKAQGQTSPRHAERPEQNAPAADHAPAPRAGEADSQKPRPDQARAPDHARDRPAAQDKHDSKKMFEQRQQKTPKPPGDKPEPKKPSAPQAAPGEKAGHPTAHDQAPPKPKPGQAAPDLAPAVREPQPQAGATPKALAQPSAGSVEEAVPKVEPKPGEPRGARRDHRPGADTSRTPQPAQPPGVPKAPMPRDNTPDTEAPAPAASQQSQGAPRRPGEHRRGPDGSPDKALPGAPNADAKATLAGPNGAPAADTKPGSQQERRDLARTPQPVPADLQNAPSNGNLNARDAEVQKLQQPVKVPSVRSQEGQRIDITINNNGGKGRAGGDRRHDNRRGDHRRPDEPQVPPGAKVVDRVGNRDILSIVGAGIAGAAVGGAAAYFIQNDDHSRIAEHARDQYAERLPGDRTRYTVVRPDGVRVVTIRNRYGDVIQRSKVLPGGREIVLFYDPDAGRTDRPDYWRHDPGADLPPLRLDIPRDEYIVDPEQPDEHLYYETLAAPPVETVDRIYSLDQVLRSQRIREKVRRIDLNTINFDTGSATIAPDQIGKLRALAQAIGQIIDKNPGETFLVEGHTDAVGSVQSNLVLSDERAQAVASALTDHFDIPPENLVAQGYGEQGLKVDTQGPSRENRRVTVLRITPLVKPIETSAR
ncbi:OmpA family protein [Jiella sp. M17.18]|uniref:OmpA family protein n=1 Tax=Jiella sp. M17.18 TaxID=3234247 RepID=UPI0034DE20B1